jgi:hypothetical protein
MRQSTAAGQQSAEHTAARSYDERSDPDPAAAALILQAARSFCWR